ncbi:hypothetical protein AC249_AIPGENE28535, partial [Exaiptasia diaphana]
QAAYPADIFKMADRIQKLRRKSSNKQHKGSKSKRFGFRASWNNEQKEIKEVEERYENIDVESIAKFSDFPLSKRTLQENFPRFSTPDEVKKYFLDNHAEKIKPATTINYKLALFKEGRGNKKYDIVDEVGLRQAYDSSGVQKRISLFVDPFLPKDARGKKRKKVQNNYNYSTESFKYALGTHTSYTEPPRVPYFQTTSKRPTKNDPPAGHMAESKDDKRAKILGQLKDLKDLLDREALTKEEFAELKKAYIADLTSLN